MKRRCCARCFGDRLIETEYIPQLDPISQTCDYCGAEDVDCVEPDLLGQWFWALVATYQEDSTGRLLVDLFRDEWGMFEGSGMNSAQQKELLDEVLDDGQVVRKAFVPISDDDGFGRLREWEDLRDEMMHHNRWFLDEPMDMDRVGWLLGQLIAPVELVSGRVWYRARLMDGERVFRTEDMGAPPPRLAGHGRANPAGIPYLYLASTRTTAVAELRPHTGEHATVARFSLSGNEPTFADLRSPRQLASPLLGDEEEIIRLRSDLPLLQRLGEELTRPVQPQGVPYEYIPTQYLSEYIKKQGFAGLLYRSSVSSDDGFNLALFDPSMAEAVDAVEVIVAEVSVKLTNQHEATG